MNYTSFQAGTLVKRQNVKGFTWVLRYRQDGKHKAMVIGTNEELPTEKDAKRKMSTMTAVINDSKAPFTFGQLVEKYIAEELPSRPQTASSYNSGLKHIKLKYADTPLNVMLKDLMGIQTWLSDLKTVARKDHPSRPLSKKTKHNIKALLHRIVNCAMKWGYLDVQANPIALLEVKVKGIQPVKRLKRPLTIEQIRDLLANKKMCEHVRVMVKLCAFLGLRISEVLGLRWEDIDFDGPDGPVLSVMRGAVGNHIDETKSETSNSVMPIHAYIAETLKAWKEVATGKNGWMFESMATGRPFHRDSLQADHLAPAGKEVGIPDLGWHTFRHTFIALHRKLKTDPETRMMLARHSDMKTTSEYGRDDESVEVKREANEALVELMLKGGCK